VRVRCNTETYTTVDDIKAGLEHTGVFSGVEVRTPSRIPRAASTSA